MVWRVLPEFSNVIAEHGIYNSICDINGHSIPSSFWTYAFAFSKILEFGDTAFIILRKQKLILLHYYHHITVAVFVFYTSPTFDPACRWFGTMNSFVHGVMYGYYALRAMGVKMPRSLPKAVTTLQLTQMFIGIAVNVLSLIAIGVGMKCGRPTDNILWALAMYASYAVLFMDFFRKSYSKKSTEIKKID